MAGTGVSPTTNYVNYSLLYAVAPPTPPTPDPIPTVQLNITGVSKSGLGQSTFPPTASTLAGAQSPPFEAVGAEILSSAVPVQHAPQVASSLSQQPVAPAGATTNYPPASNAFVATYAPAIYAVIVGGLESTTAVDAANVGPPPPAPASALRVAPAPKPDQSQPSGELASPAASSPTETSPAQTHAANGASGATPAPAPAVNKTVASLTSLAAGSTLFGGKAA